MSSFAVRLTSIIIFVVIIVWDIWLWADRIPGNTISAVITKRFKSLKFWGWVLACMLVFFMGVLSTHWFK